MVLRLARAAMNILLISGLGGSFPAWGAVTCGATLQTIWRLGPSARELRLEARARHDERICDPERLTNRNAWVELLDQRSRIVRRIPAFLSIEESSEDFSDPQAPRAAALPAHPGAGRIVQLKFADGRDFDRVRAIRIRFDSGGDYGPADF